MQQLVLQMIGSLVRLSVVALALLGLASMAQAADESRVKALYNLCTSCHGADGQGQQDIGAPSIAGLPEWYLTAQLDKFHGGVRGAHPKDIAGMRMRPIGRTLDDQDRKDIAAYVSKLPRPELPDVVKGSMVRGEVKFQVCQACHGAKAEGNQQVNAPPLVGGSDWYYLTQLKNFKARIRGGDPNKDPNGAAMQGIAATLDDDGMLDVVSYINALKPVK